MFRLSASHRRQEEYDFINQDFDNERDAREAFQIAISSGKWTEVRVEQLVPKTIAHLKTPWARG